MLILILYRYAYADNTIIVDFCIKMIMIGIKCKLKEQKDHENVSKLMSVHRFVAVLIVT